MLDKNGKIFLLQRWRCCKRPQKSHAVRATSPKRTSCYREAFGTSRAQRAGKGGFVFTALLKFPLQLHQMLRFQRIFVLIRRNRLDWLEILPVLPHFLRYAEGRRTALVFALPLLLEGCRGPPTHGGPLLLHGGEREDPVLPPGFCWGELEPPLSQEV